MLAKQCVNLREDAQDMPIRTLRIGSDGPHKSIILGMRVEEAEIEYLNGLLGVARTIQP